VMMVTVEDWEPSPTGRIIVPERMVSALWAIQHAHMNTPFL